MSARFSDAIAQAPVMLAEIDPSARCTWANDAWRAFVGPPEDALRGDWVASLDPADRNRVVELVGRDAPLDIEVKMRLVDERDRSLLLRSSPLHDSDGRLTGHLLAAVDVSGWRDAERVLRFLTSLGDVLVETTDLDEALRRVARLVAPELADLCTIAVVDDDERIRRVAISHRDPDVERFLVATQATEALEAEAPSAIAQVMRSGTVLYRPIVDAAGPDEPWPVIEGPLKPEGTRSLVCAPLVTREGVVGAIAVVSWQRRLATSDLALIQEIAHRCATAVSHAALYRRSEEARTYLALLSTFGEHLAATLDLDETTRTLVRSIVPVFADVAVVGLRRRDGSIRRSDVCHVDPSAESAYRESFVGTLVGADDPTPIAQAVRLRHPLLIEDFGAELANANLNPKRQAAFVPAESLHLRSAIVVPLVVGADVVGVLALGVGASGRRYRSSDLALALDLGRRAALAIDRARAYGQERRVAETLQHSMLPEALPEVAGVALRARYLPGGRGDVGGDWYDVVTLPEGRFGLAIGDVAGHGVRAAAVMGQLRNALRAFATDELNPATVVQRLNRFVFEQGPADMATLCYAICDPHSGRLWWTLAGHPPPLVIVPGAAPAYLESLTAPPIGAGHRARFTTQMTTLASGTMLLLYTDGLIERRGESLDVGLERLAACARFAPTLLDDACDEIIRQMLVDGHGDDDVAVLGLRFVGVQRGPIRIRRPARASELAPVRRIISAWLEATGLASEDIGVVSVAVSEAATNAIEHAYGPGEGWFEVEAAIDGDELSLAVRDEGTWRPKARGGGGRGLGLIGQLMDEFEVRRSRNGTEIWMRRMLQPAAGKDS